MRYNDRRINEFHGKRRTWTHKINVNPNDCFKYETTATAIVYKAWRTIFVVIFRVHHP